MRAVKAFDADYGARWPEAVAKITEHIDVLLAFSDDPAEHWIYLRTTNPRSRPSPPSGCVSGSPRNPARGPPESRWRSSSSSPHKPARAPSTPPTSSLWSVPAQGWRRGNSPNDPTDQEAISKSRQTPIHKSWLFLGHPFAHPYRDIRTNTAVDVINCRRPPAYCLLGHWGGPVHL